MSETKVAGCDAVAGQVDRGVRHHWQASSADDGMRNMERADTESGATDNVPYCRHCGSERLAYREQYANGSEYQCRECGEVLMW
jgi:predicted RNA-binding Zn-ribbon protein involved in translation (DUF1610 family)